jgi:microcystin-dependent protein
MTVSTQTSKSQYTGNGVTTAFTGSFRILDQTHITVILTDTSGVDTTQALTTNYTVSGVGGATFTVTFLVAPPSGYGVTIVRNVPLTQGLDLVLNDEFPSTEMENSLDKATMVDQQLKESQDRSLKFPVSDAAGLSTTLPTAAQRANKLASFDGSGQPTATAVGAIGAIALPLSVANGGTGQTTQQAALNALAGAVTAGRFLRGDGTNVSMQQPQMSDLTGTLSVAAGGTSKTTLAANNVLLGNGTSAVQEVAPGAAGNVLTSNGTTWASTAPGTVPTGAIFDFGGYTAPSGYLLCDGAAVSRTTYATLWAALSAQATVTITIASPGVVTWNSHPLQNGDPVRLQTTGALPTGLAANTTYYVVSAGANTFSLAATRGGSAINTSGTQSGVHTAIYAPHGWGDNSTTFNVPDLRGRTTAGRDNMGGTAANRLTTAGSGIAGVNLGDAGGTQTHTLTTTEMPAHTHSGGVTGGGQNFTSCGSYAVGATGSTGGGGAHQNTQPTAITNKIIKT